MVPSRGARRRRENRIQPTLVLLSESRVNEAQKGIRVVDEARAGEGLLFAVSVDSNGAAVGVAWVAEHVDQSHPVHTRDAGFNKDWRWAHLDMASVFAAARDASGLVERKDRVFEVIDEISAAVRDDFCPLSLWTDEARGVPATVAVFHENRIECVDQRLGSPTRGDVAREGVHFFHRERSALAAHRNHVGGRSRAAFAFPAIALGGGLDEGNRRVTAAVESHGR